MIKETFINKDSNKVKELFINLYKALKYFTNKNPEFNFELTYSDSNKLNVEITKL